MNTDPNSTPPEIGSAEKHKENDAQQKELAAQKERYLRLAADFEKFRKRTTLEIERRAAAEKEAFIRELLPILDNLERALAAQASSSTEQLRQGVQMTLQQLYQLLHCHGIEPEESLGQPFDPHRQEAVTTRHDSSQPDQSFLRLYSGVTAAGPRSFALPK